jgi:hypothetical protein
VQRNFLRKEKRRFDLLNEEGGGVIGIKNLLALTPGSVRLVEERFIFSLRELGTGTLKVKLISFAA